MAIKEIDFQELVEAAKKDVPVQLSEGWLDIRVKNLTPGEFYIVPLYLWCEEDREVEVKILSASGQALSASYNFKVGRQLNGNGADEWLNKRYKLNEERHNGEGRIIIGSDVDAEHPLLVVAAPLTSKKLRRKKLADEGKCPDCSTKGHWIRLSLCCPNDDCPTGAFG